MKKIQLTLICSVICSAALAQTIDREAAATAEVTLYVEDWAKNLPQKYRNRALKQVPNVAQFSVEYGIDPLLIAVMISIESSWSIDAKGKLGEIGLLQIHPLNKAAYKGYDISSGAGQLQAGIAWLRNCIDGCGGDVKRGLNAYTAGSCTKKWKGLEYRWALYRKAVKRFRND